MAVTLRNNSGRRLIFELPHDVVCTADKCLCKVIEQPSRDHNAQTGEVGTRVNAVKVPQSVFLSPRGLSEALPDAILEAPVIADLVKRGLLLKDHEEPPVKTRKKESPFSPPSSTPPTGSSGT